MSDMRAALLAGVIPGDMRAFKPYAPGKMTLHKPVAEFIEGVGGAVVDVIDWAVDEVISPVVSVVGDVIDAALDDPIKTIAQVAAVATGNAWALPLIEGADVLAAGGDLGDALEAAAIAYVATEVGTKVGSTVGSAVAKETGSKVAGQIVGSAARGATQAVVTGQDPAKAFISGGLNAAVPAALGKIDGFTELQKTSPAAASAIAAYVSAEIAGGNGSKAAISAAVANGSFVKDTIQAAKDGGINMTAEQEAIATDMLIRTTSAALTGGNVNAAIQSGLMKAGVSAIKDLINSKDANAAVSNVKTSYDKAQKAGDAVVANEKSQANVKTQYDKVALELQADIDKQNTLKTTYDKKLETYNANKTEANANAVNAAAKDYNDFVSQLKLDVDDYYKPTLDDYVKQMEGLQTNYDTLLDTYETTQNDLIKTAQKLENGLDFAYAASDAAFVKAINPGFDADAYRQMNNLDASADVYEHWLTTGQHENAPTTLAQAEANLDIERTRLITAAAKDMGVPITALSDEDRTRIEKQIDTVYGNNLTALKAATLQDLFSGNVRRTSDLIKNANTIEVYGAPILAETKHTLPNGFTFAAGTRLATAAEVEAGKAQYTVRNGKPLYITTDDSTASKYYDSSIGDYAPVLPKVVVTAPRDMIADDPEAALHLMATLDSAVEGGVDDFLYNFAAATMELAKTSGSDTLVNAAGNALKAGGGILESFNGLVVLAGKNPSNTALGKFASKLTKLGQATTTEEYKAAIQDIQKTIGQGQGVLGTAKAIWGAFKDHPVEFLAEYVGVEGMQEIVPLMVGGGATTFAKGLALARGMGVQAAERFALNTGLKVAAVSDIAESIGGTAAGTYEEAYRAAIGAGMTEAQATQAALDIAAKSGLTSGVVTALSLGVGGAALEKAFLGNKKATGELAGVFDTLKARMADGTKVTVKEGVSEGVEEGLTQAYTEGLLYKLDPTRDVTGNIASAAIFGTIAGGGIAGTTMAGKNTGDFVSNVLMSNPAVNDVVTNATSAADLQTKLTNLGITDVAQQTNLLNSKYDANYTSSQEAIDALNARGDFAYGDADVAALVGNTADNKLVDAVEAYVDPRVLDVAEVKAAAALEGVTLTDEQAAQYAKQGNEADLTSALRTELDPTATTYEEAKQFLTDLGYTPSYDEIKSFVAVKSEADQKNAIEAYVDPRQVTAEEAREFLSASGYNPTDAEVKRFTGQVNEESQKTAIDEYVDPRYVDQGEVAAAWEALGLKKPTQDDIQKFIGQYAETDLTGKAEAYLPTARYNSVLEQLDALAASSGQDQNILDAIEVVKNDFSKQVEDLGFKVDEQTGVLTDAITASENAIKEKMAEYEAAGVTRDEALQKAIDDVAADLGTTKQDLLDQIGTTEENLLTKIGETEETLQTEIGTAKEDILTELGTVKEDLSSDITGVQETLQKQVEDVETNILDRVGEYEKAGIERDEALGKAIDDVATELGTTKEALLEQIGTTETNLSEKIADTETALTGRIGETETRLTTEIQTVADILGKPAQQVTQSDIDMVADIIAQQQAEPTLQLTPEQLAYDVNQDGVIDINDQTLLDAVLKGTTEPGWMAPEGTPWAPTGVFAEQARQAELTRQAAADEAEKTRQAAAANALKTQRMGNLNTMMGMLSQASDVGGQKVTVKAPDPAKIGYVYDWSSIFANPSQQQLFASPFAKGGAVRNEVDDVNDELLRLLRG